MTGTDHWRGAWLARLSAFTVAAGMALSPLARAQDDDAVDELPDGSLDFDDDPLTDDPGDDLPDDEVPADGPGLAPVEVPAPRDPADSLRDILRPSDVPRAERFFRDLSYGLPRVPLTAVATDPGDTEVILVGADGFVFKSDDGGDTWRPVLSFPRGLPDGTPLPRDTDNDFDDADDDADDPNALPMREDDDDPEQVDLDDPDDAEDLLEDAEDNDVPDFEDRAFTDEDLPDGDVDTALSGNISPRLLEGVRAIKFISPRYRTVYVATPRGLFRSIDIGETFEQIALPGGLAANDVRDVAIDQRSPTRVYLATRQGLFVSDDGGASFEEGNLPNRVPALCVYTAQVGDEDLVLVGTERGLLRSWDRGFTFGQLLLSGVNAFTPVQDVAFDPREDVTYAATNLGLFVSVRRAPILERRREMGSVPVYAVSVDPARPLGVAVTQRDMGVLISDDTGLSQVPLPDPFPAPDALGLTRSPDDGDRLLIATERGLFAHAKGSGVSATADQLRKLQDAYRKEPTLSEAAHMAMRYFRIHPDSYNYLARRVRHIGYGPAVQFIYRYTNGRSTRFDEDLVLTEDAPDDFDTSDINDINELYELGILVRAPQRGNFHAVFVLFQWDFDRLWYNEYERSVMSFRPRLRTAQQRVINRLEILYGVRRRIVTDVVLGRDPQDVSSLATRAIRLQEVTAQLDGLTGGGYSDAMLELGGKPWELTFEPPPRRLSFTPALAPDAPRVARGRFTLHHDVP